MRILAVASIKGGVGKTSTAVNLAYLSSCDWARTLVWDLDPQAAATFYFRVRPKLKGGAAKLLGRRRAIDGHIRGTDYDRLDILPADTSCRNFDLFLDDLKKPRRGIRKAVKSMRGAYDCVILDCPPNLSLLSENVFRVADALLVPIIPTTLSLRTLDQLIRFCKKEKLTRPKILPFFSMVERRKKLHRQIIESAANQNPEFLRSRIPYASLVEQMGIHRAPLATFAKRSPATSAYEKLWREIEIRLGE